MHRKPLLDKLTAYKPTDSSEARMAERLRQFMEENTACFDRSLKFGHITGSAWIIDRTREHALLTHHRKLNNWLQPGGHADGDPDVLCVAMREAREESGLCSIRAVSEQIFDIDIHVIPAREHEPEHLHYDVRFLLEADRSARLTTSGESHAVAWIPLSQIVHLNPEESLARMVAKTRRLFHNSDILKTVL